MTETVFQDPISEERLADLVNRFYAKVRKDALIGPLFNSAIHDWDHHLKKLAAFWSSIMLGSGRYRGNPMAAHVKHREAITPDMFQRWLALWGETTDECFEPDIARQLQLKAAMVADSLQLALVYRARRDAAEAAATAKADHA